MKKISGWAKQHVVYTRIIITGIHLLLILLAYCITQNFWFHFSLKELCFVIALLVVASAVYPYAKQISYAAQKVVLFITSCCFFLIMCYGMMHNFMLSSSQQALSAYSLPFDTTKTNSQNMLITSAKNYKSMSRHDKKEFRKNLKQQLKIYKKEMPKHGRPTGQDALLIFLIVLCSIALVFGLSILVCGISCGGVSGGVIILTLLGMGGVGVGLYFIIKKLKQNVDNEQKKMNEKLNGKSKHFILFPSV